MKNQVLKSDKKFTKVSEKLFTKKKENDTIRKDYNPLKVNYKIYRRGSGLYMESEILFNELLKELNIIERMFFKRKIIEIYKKGIKKGFKWANSVR